MHGRVHLPHGATAVAVPGYSPCLHALCACRCLLPSSWPCDIKLSLQIVSADCADSFDVTGPTQYAILPACFLYSAFNKRISTSLPHVATYPRPHPRPHNPTSCSVASYPSYDYDAINYDIQTHVPISSKHAQGGLHGHTGVRAHRGHRRVPRATGPPLRAARRPAHHPHRVGAVICFNC